jgi:CheY-like chemotaxis protein
VRLAQVLGNLLNNAAKYTEDGGKIWLTVERANGEAVCRVRDTGLGIPPDMLASVFDPFTQVDRSLDRSQGGLGIGLTLVKQLVELHAGRVQVHSAGLDQGSEFIVRLPVLAGEVPHGASANGTPAPPPVDVAPCRVLVVDDNVDGAESLAVLLRLGGHEVRVCHDGPASLMIVDEFRPEMVFLDIGLPGLDGYEVAWRLRARPERIALIALTGYGQEEDVRRSRQAGFDRHLVKPADPASLAALFEALGNGIHARSRSAS